MHRVFAPEPVVNPLDDQQADGADNRAHDLAQQIVVLVLVAVKRLDEAGAVDHHEAEGHQ